MALLNGSAVSRARLYLPGYGIWSARVSTAAPLVLATGQRVSLVIGDLTLSGAVRRGGTYLGESSFLLVGGADGWRKRLAPRAYRADNGVRSASAASDLAADTGEVVTLEVGLAPFLGAAWSRDAGLASDRLADVATRLGARVWMTPDGVTHLGKVRPVAELPRALPFAVESFCPARGRARLACPEDRIAAFQPGTMFRAPGVEPFVIAAVEIDVEPGGIVVTGSARDPAAMFQACIAARDPGRLHGHYVYQVREQQGARLSVRALEAVAGLPDQLLIDKAHGIAGASGSCAPGSSVLVGFRGGSPASPYVAAYLPGALPLSTRIDAAGLVTVGDPGGTPKPVGRVGDLTIGGTLSGVAPPGGGAVTFTYTPPGGAPTASPTVMLSGEIKTGSSKLQSE